MIIFEFAKILGLFVLTAIAEIVGCYLPWLYLKHGAVLHDVCLHLHHYRTGEQDALLPVKPLLAEFQPALGYGLPTNFPEEP